MFRPSVHKAAWEILTLYRLCVIRQRQNYTVSKIVWISALQPTACQHVHRFYLLIYVNLAQKPNIHYTVNYTSLYLLHLWQDRLVHGDSNYFGTVYLPCVPNAAVLSQIQMARTVKSCVTGTFLIWLSSIQWLVMLNLVSQSC